MAQDLTESAPIGLVAKIIIGFLIGVSIIILLGFIFVFDEAREFLLPILVGHLGMIVFAIAFILLTPWFFQGGQLLFDFFSKGGREEVFLDSLGTKGKFKKQKNTAIRKAIRQGQQRRKQ